MNETDINIYVQVFVWAKIIKFLEENIEVSLSDLVLAITFLDWTPKAQVLKKIEKFDFKMNRNFYSSKNTIKEVKKINHGMGENILNNMSNKGLETRIYK